MYTFFEPELPSDPVGIPRIKVADALKLPGERQTPLKLPVRKSSSKLPQSKAQRPLSSVEKKANNHICGSGRRPSQEKTSWNVLDLKGENYFSCAVGRTRTNARYKLGSSDEVVAFMKELAGASVSS